jgi:hypothetical protein
MRRPLVGFFFCATQEVMPQQNMGIRNQTLEKQKADIVSAFCI